MSDEQMASGPLTAGSMAPDFTLPARSGKTISLHDFAGRKDVLVYFYPKDDTPGCTREACSLRDAWSDLGRAGIEVLGISRDDAASHNAFAAKYNLPFELLSDPDHSVHEKYGAWGQNPNPAWGIGPLRKSFLVGKDGRIKRVFDKVDTEHHADQVLRSAGFAPAPAVVSPAPKPAAPPAPRPAAPAAEAPKPAAPVKKPARKAGKMAARRVKRLAARVKIRRAVRKAVRKAAKKKAAPGKRSARRTARRSARRTIRRIRRAARRARRTVRRVRRVARRAKRTVRRVKRVARRAKRRQARRKR